MRLELLTVVVLALAAASAAGAAPRDLADTLQPILARHKVPALAGAIVTKDGAVAVGAVGVRKRGDATPVTADDKFHLGSCTKAMTATLVGMLVDEGKLKWTSTPASVWATLAPSMHAQYRSVTLEELLCHRSGISAESWPQGKTFVQMHRLHGKPRDQRREYVRLILTEPPAGEPRAAFLYSNRNYAIAGAMAETVSGIGWEDLMRRRIFGPLKMTSAGFGAPATPGKVDQPWAHLANGTPAEPGPLGDNPAVIGPGGTVHASMADWASFVAAHLRADLAKPATMRRLQAEPHPGWDYGYGWNATQRPWGGGRVLTHSGSNNMNFCVVWMAPERGFAVLAAANQGGDDAAQACDEVASALIQAHLATKR